jgi:hypothetical protein
VAAICEYVGKTIKEVNTLKIKAMEGSFHDDAYDWVNNRQELVLERDG